jgi:hypothetical protein
VEQTGDDNYIIMDFVFVIKKGGISIYDYEFFFTATTLYFLTFFPFSSR